MIRVLDAGSFFDEQEKGMFYVGFLKSAETWFPLCLVSSPEEEQHLDTLFLSPSYAAMTQTLEVYSKQLPQISETFVQYLTPMEIKNLLERFALRNIALVSTEDEGEGACGCGCGCS